MPSKDDVLKALVDAELARNPHPDQGSILREWREDNTSDEERRANLTDDERAAEDQQRAERDQELSRAQRRAEASRADDESTSPEPVSTRKGK